MGLNCGCIFTGPGTTRRATRIRVRFLSFFLWVLVFSGFSVQVSLFLEKNYGKNDKWKRGDNYMNEQWLKNEWTMSRWCWWRWWVYDNERGEEKAENGCENENNGRFTGSLGLFWPFSLWLWRMQRRHQQNFVLKLMNLLSKVINFAFKTRSLYQKW